MLLIQRFEKVQTAMGNYFGSQATSGLCQPIIAMMPTCDTYIETHLGGGAIMQRKSPMMHKFAIDPDPKPLATFDCGYPIGKVHGCAHQFLCAYDYHERELVYCDPPYLHHASTSGRRYHFEYEEQDHIELLELSVHGWNVCGKCSSDFLSADAGMPAPSGRTRRIHLNIVSTMPSADFSPCDPTGRTSRPCYVTR